MHRLLSTRQRKYPFTFMFMLAACFTLLPAPANAREVTQPSGWGLGLMLGSPTGLTAKYWLGGRDAIDLGVGVGPGVRIHGDYLWGIAELLTNTTNLTLDLYAGLGAAAAFAEGPCFYTFGNRHNFCDGGFFLGGRVPFGIDLRLANAPVSFGLEVAPGVWFSRYFASMLLDAFLYLRIQF